MGKYTHLRHKLPAFEKSAAAQGMAAWYAKVNEWRKQFVDGADNPEAFNPAMIAAEYAKRDAEKDQLEARVKQLNIELEALSKLGLEVMEDSNMQKVDLASGGYVSIKDTPYYSTEDRSKAFAWIKRNKMIELLTLHYQTMTGLNNERLLAGKPLIPGTKVFMKTKLTVRGVNGSSGDEGEQE